MLELKDISGKVVLKMAPQESNAKIQTTQLKNSVYILSCFVKKEWISRKIIINKEINLFTSFLIVKNFTKIQSFIALFCIYSYSVSSQIEKPNDKSIIQSSNKINVLLIIADDLNCDLGALQKFNRKNSQH